MSELMSCKDYYNIKKYIIDYLDAKISNFDKIGYIKKCERLFQDSKLDSKQFDELMSYIDYI